jgi:hypothetical protein
MPAVTYSTCPTAEPGPARAVLPDLGPKNTKIMIFQGRSRSQGIRPNFSIVTTYIEYCTHYNYLGLKQTQQEVPLYFDV